MMTVEIDYAVIDNGKVIAIVDEEEVAEDIVEGSKEVNGTDATIWTVYTNNQEDND